MGTASSAKVRLRVIGSSALMLQTDYARGTKDSDVLETADLTETAALTRRREIIRETDAAGLLATPANSFVNELVVEAARRSILADGAWEVIGHQ